MYTYFKLMQGMSSATCGRKIEYFRVDQTGIESISYYDDGFVSHHPHTGLYSIKPDSRIARLTANCQFTVPRNAVPATQAEWAAAQSKLNKSEAVKKIQQDKDKATRELLNAKKPTK